MRIEWISVGDVAFIAQDRLYVADVDITFRGESFPGSHNTSGHKLHISTRFSGTSDLSFEQVEQMAIDNAKKLLGIAADNLTDATPASLLKHNEEIQERQDAEMKAMWNRD